MGVSFKEEERKGVEQRSYWCWTSTSNGMRAMSDDTCMSEAGVGELEASANRETTWNYYYTADDLSQHRFRNRNICTAAVK